MHKHLNKQNRLKFTEPLEKVWLQKDLFIREMRSDTSPETT